MSLPTAHKALIKKKLKQRLIDEGRWPEYVKHRDNRVKADGVPEEIAWMVAAIKFPPLDGSPLEFELDGELLSIAKAMDEPTVEKKAYTKGVTAHADAWAALRSKVDRERDAPFATVAMWAFNNAGADPEEISPDEVPSRGALWFLKHLTSATNYANFVNNTLPKFLPTKQQIESDARFSDDGRQQFELLQNVENELYSAAAEGEVA